MFVDSALVVHLQIRCHQGIVVVLQGSSCPRVARVSICCIIPGCSTLLSHLQYLLIADFSMARISLAGPRSYGSSICNDSKTPNFQQGTSNLPCCRISLSLTYMGFEQDVGSNCMRWLSDGLQYQDQQDSAALAQLSHLLLYMY